MSACARALDSEPELPEKIGNYRILRLLGEGGMGSVFEAQQEQPRRKVALKVIRTGLLTSQVLQRFAQESQALARLQHPGIAQVYEAGTADYGWGSQPYFVMEFIEGVSLDRYVSLHRLDTRQRLELMLQVCDAVEHAHGRGVIHRDLKPGNVLVDENGKAKIHDFGLARITDSDAQATRQTDVGQLLGTLAYMSPEQVLADPAAIDTRSDVYALGVILYELLAGKLPYAISRQLHEAVQAIREQDAAPLSAVSHVYRGDIETIVAKALEKDRERRYASVAELAADIRRHMEDQPIQAKPPSTIYQLTKFARRHRAFVIGLAAVFVVLIAGVLSSMREASLARAAERAALAAQQAATRDRDRAVKAESQAVQDRNAAVASEAQAQKERKLAIEEKKRADREAAIAAAVNGFLQNDLLAQASANKQSARRAPPDPDLKVRTALDRAAERIAGKFDKQPEVEAAIRSTMGDAYTDLGVYAEARKQLERALELRRLALGLDHPMTIRTTNLLGRTAFYQGKYAESASHFARSLASSRRVLEPQHPETLVAITGLANAYHGQGKYAPAEALYNEILAIKRPLSGPESVDTRTRHNLASVYSAQGKYAQAEALQLETIKIMNNSFGPEDPSTLEGMTLLGTIYQLAAKYKEAEAIHLQVLGVRRRILGPDHRDTLYSNANVCGSLLGQGRYKEVEQRLSESLPVIIRVLGSEHSATLIDKANLALALQSQAKYSQAEALYIEVMESQRRRLGAEHPDTLRSMYNAALNQTAMGKYVEAESLMLKALEGRRRVLGPEHPLTLSILGSVGILYQTWGKYSLAESYTSEALTARRRILGPSHLHARQSAADLALAYYSQGKWIECEAAAREAIAASGSKEADDWERHRALALLGASLSSQKKYEAAEGPLLEGLRGLESAQNLANGAERTPVKNAREWVVGLYQAWGKAEKAAEWAKK